MGKESKSNLETEAKEEPITEAVTINGITFEPINESWMEEGMYEEGMYEEEMNGESNIGAELNAQNVEKVMGDPAVKKLSDYFRKNQDAALKAAKLLADYETGAINEYKEFTTGEKVKSILTSVGLGSIGSFLMATFIAGSQVLTPESWPVILVGALIGAGIGAVATDGFKGSFLDDTPKDKVNEGSNDIEQQIQNILAIGGEVQM